MTAEKIAKALGGRRAGATWMARYPAHEDREPSLSISAGPDGKVAGALPLRMFSAGRHHRFAGARPVVRHLFTPPCTSNACRAQTRFRGVGTQRDGARHLEFIYARARIAGRVLSSVSRHQLAAPRCLAVSSRTEASLRRPLASDGRARDERRGWSAYRNPSHIPRSRRCWQSTRRSAENDAWSVPWRRCASC